MGNIRSENRASRYGEPKPRLSKIIAANGTAVANGDQRSARFERSIRAAKNASGHWPRERPAMYIYGTSQIHTAQPLSAPHRLTPNQAASGGYSSGGVDQLDI